MRNSKGVTLIEIIVVVVIIGILIVALGFSFQGWKGKYRVEKTTKDIYTDMMSARAMAMQRNRTFFTDFPTSTSYRVADDANENDAIDAGEPLPSFPKTLDFAVIVNGTSTFTFDKRGLISPQRTICIFTDLDGDGISDYDPDYDCIVISQTRINMGKIINQGNPCGTDNCEAK